ncbi:MAG: hypothetical protein IKM68_03575 [Bacteroidaceae bacterium]|nr:hypothetical protein [Bacteroidaceae bacterium]
MADSILRLRVESNEYDSKIKRAQQGLLHMEEACRKVGGTLAVLEKEEKDFVQSLGSMETVSKTARGRISELTTAFTELSMQYKRLTDEEKQGDFGKALSGSLEQLKTRIAETKSQLAETNRELSGTPSLFDQLTSRLTVNIDAVKLFNVGLQAANAALDVAKDAFFQSESNIDEWGRTVEGAKGAYEVFLNALNTGNWSNFFNNLSKAIQGGRELYDALDRLGSIKSNNQAAIALAQAQIQQLRVLKQQGKDVDDEIKSATQRLKELQGQSVRAGKTAGRTEIVNTLRNEVAGRNTTGVQIDDRQLRAAAQRVLKEGQAYFDGMAKLVRQYEGNTKYQTTRTTYTQTGSTIGGSKAVDVTEFDLSKLSKQQQQQYLIAKAITEGETRIQVGISTFAQAVQEGAQSAREEFRGNRYAASGSGGGGGKSGSTAPEVFPEGSLKQLQQEMKGLQDAQALVTSPEEWKNYQTQIDEVSKRIDNLKGKVADVELFPNLDVTSDALSPLDALKEKIATSLADAAAQVDETTISTLMRTVIANGIEGLDLDFASLQEMMAEGLDIPDEKFEELQNKINEKLQAMGIDPINIDFKTGEIGKEVVKTANDTNKAWQAAANAISSAGSAMQNIEDPAAQVAGIVMQAVANIALGFSKQSIEAAGGGPFAWIAATLSGLAVMTSTIASIKNATKGGFASGGIVPGNSFSGDNLHTEDYGINAGELILSRSQQYAVASQLEGNSVQGGSSQPYVNAETIFLGLNNYLRREGRGEIVTSKSR